MTQAVNSHPFTVERTGTQVVASTARTGYAARVMSPSVARMAEVVETSEMADSVEQVVERPQVAEVIETAGSDNRHLSGSYCSVLGRLPAPTEEYLLRALRLQCEEMSFKWC